MKKRNRSEDKLNLLLLVCTLILSVLTGFGMQYAHTIAAFINRDSHLFMPLFMAALFSVFLLITSLLVFLISNLKLTYRADVITGKNNKSRIFLYLLAGIVLIGLILFGGEFLYEQDFHLSKKAKGADTYVFLIDDSSSMISSDSQNMRYKVVETMLADKSAKTQFAVYAFSDTTKLLVPMQTVDDGFRDFADPDYAITNMKAGLEKVILDCENGIWRESGETTVILITDGAPSDFSDLNDIHPLLDRYVKRGIRIGIVGVIGANNQLMNAIAAYTDGSFTAIDDAGLMDDAVNQVSGFMGRTRDLLSQRNAVDMNWLYAMIRAVTIALAGTVMAVTAAFCYGNNTAFRFIVWVNTVKAILAGILMEVAFLAPAISMILRLVSWVLMGTVIARTGLTEEPDISRSIDMDFFDTPTDNRKVSSYRY